MTTPNTPPPNQPARLAVDTSGTPAAGITEPNSGFKDVGFQPRQTLPAQFLNWLFSTTYLTLKWLLSQFDATGLKRPASVDTLSTLAALTPQPIAWAPNTFIAKGTYVNDGAGHIYYASATTGFATTGSSNPFDLDALADSPVTDNEVTWTAASNQSGYGVQEGDVFLVRGIGHFRYYQDTSAAFADDTPRPANLVSSLIMATSQGAVLQGWLLTHYFRIGAAGGVPQLDTNAKTALPHLQLAPAPWLPDTRYSRGERVVVHSAVWEATEDIQTNSTSTGFPATPAIGNTHADLVGIWKCVDDAAPWYPETVYAANQRVRVRGDGIWKVTSVTSDGTSGTTQPAWDQSWSSGSPGTDNNVRWEYVETQDVVFGSPFSDRGLVLMRDGRIDTRQLTHDEPGGIPTLDDDGKLNPKQMPFPVVKAQGTVFVNAGSATSPFATGVDTIDFLTGDVRLNLDCAPLTDAAVILVSSQDHAGTVLTYTGRISDSATVLVSGFKLSDGTSYDLSDVGVSSRTFSFVVHDIVT